MFSFPIAQGVAHMLRGGTHSPTSPHLIALPEFQLRRNLNSCYVPRLDPMPAPYPQGILTLARAKIGERLRVVTICPDCPECVRLREIGFQDQMEVRKVSDGAAIICSLLGMRVAIGRDLGEHVRVERVAA